MIVFGTYFSKLHSNEIVVKTVVDSKLWRYIYGEDYSFLADFLPWVMECTGTQKTCLKPQGDTSPP